MRPAPPPPTPTTATAAGVDERRAWRAWCWCAGDEVEGGHARCAGSSADGLAVGGPVAGRRVPDKVRVGSGGVESVGDWRETSPPPPLAPGCRKQTAPRRLPSGQSGVDGRAVTAVWWGGASGHSAAADPPPSPRRRRRRHAIVNRLQRRGRAGGRGGCQPGTHSGGGRTRLSHITRCGTFHPPSTPHPLTRTGDGRAPDEWAVAEGLVASAMLRMQRTCERGKSTLQCRFLGHPCLVTHGRRE